MLIRAVIDTNVLISGIITNNENSPTYKIVDEIYNGNIAIIYSAAIIKEYIDVLYRDKFKIDDKDVFALISSITRYGLETSYQNSTIEFTDESDRKFYDAYSVIKNAVLITGNIKHFPKDKNIVTPREFLNVMEKKK